MKYINSEKLIAEIERLKERAQAERVLHPKTILAAKDYLLIRDYDKLLSFITSLQQEPAKGIDGVVHHYLNTYWIVTDKKQLATALKVFPEGAEVELFIFAKKEDTK